MQAAWEPKQHVRAEWMTTGTADVTTSMTATVSINDPAVVNTNVPATADATGTAILIAKFL